MGLISNRPVPDWKYKGFMTISGKVTLLHINDINYTYGPKDDNLDADVIVTLDSVPDMAFGFKLRQNDHKWVAQGMLQLLMEAYRNNWVVNISYHEYWYKNDPNKKRKNNNIERIWVKK